MRGELLGLPLPCAFLSSSLAPGRGHNLYGESAWPSDILFAFAPVILALGAAPRGLAAACPPSGGLAPASPFPTPAEILPEFYLYAAFNLIRALGSKVAGGLSAAALLARLAAAPFSAESAQHFFQSPFRRPAGAGACLLLIAGDVLLTAGAACELELSVPLPQTARG